MGGKSRRRGKWRLGRMRVMGEEIRWSRREIGSVRRKRMIGGIRVIWGEGMRLNLILMGRRRKRVKGRLRWLLDE